MKDESLMRLNNALRTEERRLKALTSKYKLISEQTMNELGDVVNKILKDSNIATIYNSHNAPDNPILNMQSLEDSVFVDDDERVALIDEITECYYDIAAIHKKMREWELDTLYLDDYAIKPGSRTIERPSAITNASASADFGQWLQMRSDTLKNLPFV